MKKVILTLLVLFYMEVECLDTGTKLYVPTYEHNTHPCNGSDDVQILYDSDIPKEDENQYQIFINKTLTRNMKIIISLDSDSVVTLRDKGFARVFHTKKNTFEIRVFKLHNGLFLNVKGEIPNTVPIIKSLIINTKEYCRHALLRNIDGVFWEYKDYTEPLYKSRGDCGRRKVANTRLLQNGASTQPGDWPWHSAIYKHDNTEIKYMCGGTLVSNNFVLTAAQCTSFEGTPFVPETLSVFFGKFNLIGGDKGTQQKVVTKIVNHENFGYRNFDNDVSLLKLRTDVVFSDFVQPACLWNKGLDSVPNSEVYGTIVGWGFDTTDSLSPHLKQIQMPMVSEYTCLNSNPLVFSTVLNSDKFCAGYGVRDEKIRGGIHEQDTPNCNGDRGSAFQIFIPDRNRVSGADGAGAWYVRGIVSLTVPRRDSPTCDPQQYVVFTDVARYSDWIDLHMRN